MCLSTSFSRALHGQASPEFTLSKYRARENSVGTGYQRGTDFCILTLRHPDIASEADGSTFRGKMDALYDRRDDPSSPSRLVERVDELFTAYDLDENGLLDPQELREAREKREAPLGILSCDLGSRCWRFLPEDSGCERIMGGSYLIICKCCVWQAWVHL